MNDTVETPSVSSNAKPIRIMELLQGQEGNLTYLEIIPDTGPDWGLLPAHVITKAKCLTSLGVAIGDLVVVALPVQRASAPMPAGHRNPRQRPSDGPAHRFSVYRVVATSDNSGLELDDPQVLPWATAKVDPSTALTYALQERTFLQTYKNVCEQAERKKAAAALLKHIESMGLGDGLKAVLACTAPEPGVAPAVPVSSEEV